MNCLLQCQLAHDSTESSQSRTDITHNAAKLKERQASESSSAYAVSFAYRIAFC